MNVVAKMRREIVRKDTQNTILLNAVQTFPLGRFFLVWN
jgi:hypothetical protein